MLKTIKHKKISETKKKLHLLRFTRSYFWHLTALVFTITLATMGWLLFALSSAARAWLTHSVRSLPEPLSSNQILIAVLLLLPISIIAYFWTDYQQYIRLLRKDDPNIKYTPTYHAKKVVLPKLRYNWKQSLYWVGYGMASVLLLLSIVAYRVSPVYAYAPNEFVTTWNPANDGDPSTIDIYAENYTYTYDFNVDWGDGNTESNLTDSISHTYSTGGVYTVKITGQYPKLFLNSTDLLSVEQWGNSQWQSTENMFSNTGSLTINAVDTPDLSQVTDMSYMFSYSGMNSDISDWDTSHVQNMDQMFRSNASFDQPIGLWDTSSLTSAEFMFGSASAFNQPLNSWNTANLTNVYGVFDYATSFNQPLNNWNTSKVTNMDSMFTGATSFNQPLNNWDTSSVTNMSGMFALANAFNQSLGSWDVSNVTDMGDMFGITGYFTGLSSYNYDSTLVNWSTLSLQSGVTFEAGSSTYCNASSQRSDIISNFGWTIHDGGVSCPAGATGPLVITETATSITDASATLNAEVLSDGGDTITAAGFEYDTSTTFGSDTGSITTSVAPYTFDLSSLNCGTKYYFRAYATNSVGTSYGVNRSFTTTVCPFITTWKTDNPGSSAANQITIPTSGDSTYNYNVDWGDTNTDSGVTGSITHTYASPGEYTVKISGTFPAIYFNNSGDRQKILSLEQWGGIHWDTMNYAFYGASNLTIPATDVPDLSSVTQSFYMFADATSFNQDISGWDVHTIHDMSYMFSGATSFNQDISAWDTSGLNFTLGMFSGATSFNQPLNEWNVSNVSVPGSMFRNATSFNQPLGSWVTSGFTDTTSMFDGATSFNQDISGWTMTSVTSATHMFRSATSFNQPLNGWDTSNITNMRFMFSGATSFNQPLDAWNVDSVNYMNAMFSLATSFDQDLSAWHVSSVYDMTQLFYQATNFNQSLASWDIQNVSSMTGMLTSTALTTTNYDATLIEWSSVGSVQNGVTLDATPTKYCNSVTERGALINTYGWTINDGGQGCPDDFTGAFITSWRTTNPGSSDSDQITIPLYSGESYNFRVDWGDGNVDTNLTGPAEVSHTYATAGDYDVKIIGTFPRIYFNDAGDKAKITAISQWGDNSWTSMAHAFDGASNLVLSASDTPDLSGATDMSYMFSGASSFNRDISNWQVGSITNMRGLFSGATSFNQSIDAWDTANVTDMSFLFDGATSFNQPLASWDVSKVTLMQGMFADATSFDQPLNNWGSKTGSVTNMSNMFFNSNNGVFNQNISSWDTAKVLNMFGMFYGQGSFNQPLNSWDVGSVTDMSFMFKGSRAFNRPLDTWQTGNVTDMYAMFDDANVFNQDISNWDTGNVISMEYMFFGAEDFNQSLASWDVQNVTEMGTMLIETALTTENYDATLISWANQTLKNNVTLDASATYCLAEAARQHIIDTYNWTINDGGKNCTTQYKQVNTDAPNKLSSSQAKLNGSVIGAGAGDFVSAGFEWGKTESYGNTISGLTIGSSSFNSTVNLGCDTQYHYRAYAVDGSDNKTYGANTTFTLACPTKVEATYRAPGIIITKPKDGEGYTLGSDVNIYTKLTKGTSEIKEVRFYIDGDLFKTVKSSPYRTIFTNPDAGIYKLIAVVEDADGKEVATTQRTFSVNKNGNSVPAILNSLDTGGGELDDVTNPSSLSRNPIIQILKSLPWILLLLLSLVYLTMAYLEARSNKILRAKIALVAETRESIDGFLHIVTHYLATPLTIMSLSIESLGEQTRVTLAIRNQLAHLKQYVNQLIADLNTKASEIKNKLMYGGKINKKSRMLWVVAPSAGALAILIIAGLGLTNFSSLSFSQNFIIFTTAMTLGSAGATYFFFEMWQHERQLHSDLLATQKTAESSLRSRQEFILANEHQLDSEFGVIEENSRTLPDGEFKATFNNGKRQYKNVINAFEEVSQLIAASPTLISQPWNGEATINKLRQQSERKGVRFDFSGPLILTSYLTDQEIEKVVSALIGNAIEFTYGGGEIRVKSNSNGKGFEFSVEDTGTGIEKDKLKALMQPFSRGTDSETYDYEGIGLNLYIVRLIAEKYSGSVDISSVKGQGTKVTFKV